MNKKRHENFTVYVITITAVYKHCYEHYDFTSRYNTPDSAYYIDNVAIVKAELFEHLEFITRKIEKNFKATEDRRHALEIIKGAAELADKSFQNDRYISELVYRNMMKYLKEAQKEANFICLTYI